MGREVIKTVGRRRYRYAIERVVDAASGATRRKWRYVGTASALDPVEIRPGARSTRDRLIDAFERVLSDRPFDEVSVSAIGPEAGLAHGTFYRYFRDKDAILEAAIGRARSAVDLVAPRFGDRLGTMEEERERVTRWLDVVTGLKHERTALIRAWLLRHTKDDAAEQRRLRRQVVVARFAEYLRALESAGLAKIPEPLALSQGIFLAIEGSIKRAVYEDEKLDEASIAALYALVQRAIFDVSA